MSLVLRRHSEELNLQAADNSWPVLWRRRLKAAVVSTEGVPEPGGLAGERLVVSSEIVASKGGAVSGGSQALTEASLIVATLTITALSST